jgi:hypothetical protein
LKGRCRLGQQRLQFLQPFRAHPFRELVIELVENFRARVVARLYVGSGRRST